MMMLLTFLCELSWWAFAPVLVVSLGITIVSSVALWKTESGIAGIVLAVFGVVFGVSLLVVLGLPPQC